MSAGPGPRAAFGGRLDAGSGAGLSCGTRRESGSGMPESRVRVRLIPVRDTMLALTDIEAAARNVYAAMQPTPQYAWPLLAQRAGCEVWVKHENHTPTGAFKVRGGLHLLASLKARDPAFPGVISATRGNHGQSLAFAARRHGVRGARSSCRRGIRATRTRR